MKKYPMLPIFLTVFLGFIGISLPFPIFAPLILNPESHFFAMPHSGEVRSTLLGFVLATYPLGQFLGAPILGQLSDRYGRKPLLIISLVGTFLAHAATGICIFYSSFVGLILSRFIAGLMEGNIAIAQSAAADLGKGSSEIKTRNFSYINTASYLGFLVGPIVGGVLGDPNLGFSYAFPFFVSSLFSLFTLIIIALMFQNTFKKVSSSINLFTAIRRLGKSWSERHMRLFYLINFLLFMSMYFFFQFYAPFVTKLYDFTPFLIAIVCAYLSICMTLAQTFLVPRLSKKLSPYKAAAFSGLGIAITLFLAMLIKHPYALIFLIPLCACFFATAMTNLSVMISNAAHDDEQGEAMGVTNSTQVLGEGIVCLVGGYLSGLLVGLPFLAGSIAALATSFIIYTKLIKKTL